jgi:integrase/recombinase XerD
MGNPARVYVWELAPSGRPAAQSRLSKFAELLGFTLDSYDWPGMTVADVLTVRARLREEDASPPMINMVLSHARSVARMSLRLGLDRMTAERCAAICLVEGVKGSSLPAGRALSPAEIEKLFETCSRDTSTAGVRDLALLALLYYGGLRRHEPLRLEPSDYGARDHRLSIVGKGNKGEFVYLEVKRARLALARWIRRRGQTPGPLFCALRRGGRLQLVEEGGERRARALTGDAVYRVVLRRASLAGVAPCTPHDLRRSAITNLLEGGADAAAVQEWARHNDLRTTKVYDRRRERAKKSCARRLGPPPFRPRPRRKPHRPKKGRPRMSVPLENRPKFLLLELARAHGADVDERMTRVQLARAIREKTS